MDMHNKVFNWVVSNGYKNVHDWAFDSDYYHLEGSWYNDDDNKVDIWQCAYYAMEASKEDNS